MRAGGAKRPAGPRPRGRLLLEHAGDDGQWGRGDEGPGEGSADSGRATEAHGAGRGARPAARGSCVFATSRGVSRAVPVSVSAGCAGAGQLQGSGPPSGRGLGAQGGSLALSRGAGCAGEAAAHLHEQLEPAVLALLGLDQLQGGRLVGAELGGHSLQLLPGGAVELRQSGQQPGVTRLPGPARPAPPPRWGPQRTRASMRSPTSPTTGPSSRSFLMASHQQSGGGGPRGRGSAARPGPGARGSWGGWKAAGVGGSLCASTSSGRLGKSRASSSRDSRPSFRRRWWKTRSRTRSVRTCEASVTNSSGGARGASTSAGTMAAPETPTPSPLGNQMPPFLSPWAAATVALLDGCTDPGLSPGPATEPPRLGTRPAPSPLMTSCRSTSLWLSPATTSLPTVCCQFWASGSGSRSDSWPRSSSRRWGRRTSEQNPRLGDSTLLGKTDARLRPDGRRARGVCPRLPVPSDGRDGRARLRHGRRTGGPPRPAHLRPILGVKGGVGFSRDLWGEGRRSVGPRPQLRWAWRPEPRIPGGEAGGGGRGRLVEAGGLGGGVHVHVAAGARHAVCLPGARQLLPALQALGAAQADLGTRAGGGKRPQPVSWPAAPAAISRRLHVQRPPPRPKHQSFLDGSWFSATPACLSGSPVPGGGRRHRPLTPRERGCAAHGPQRDARPAAVGWPACLPCRGRCQRRARPLTRSPAREPGSVVPVLTLARRLVGGLAGRPPRFPHSRLMRPPEAPAPPPGAGGFLPGAARRLWGAGCWLRARLQCRGPETAAWLDARPRPSRVSPGARCPPSVRTPRGPEGPSLGLEATRQLTRPDAPTGPSEQFQPRRPQTVTNTPTGRVAHDRPRPGREAAGVQSSQKRGTRPISGLRLPALRFLCQPRAPRLQATPQGPREQLRADSPRHFRNVTSQTGSDIFTRRCHFLRLPDPGRPPHQRPPLGPAQL